MYLLQECQISTPGVEQRAAQCFIAGQTRVDGQRGGRISFARVEAGPLLSGQIHRGVGVARLHRWICTTPWRNSKEKR